MNYEQALNYSLNTFWKIDVCNSGESCWCRLILPLETIKYTEPRENGESYNGEVEWIIPDGSVDEKTAKHIVDLHNSYVKRIQYDQEKERLMKNLSDLNKHKELN